MDQSPVTQPRTGLQWRAEGGVRQMERITPREEAVGLSFDGRPHTVLMTTPADLQDLAIGFAITEGVAEADEILAVTEKRTEAGVLIDLALSPAGRVRRARPRGLEGRSSCGLCGVQRLADAVRPLPRVRPGQSFRHEAAHSATEAISELQTLGRLTRATHAAAFARADGTLVMVREDVGRHNALDKLAGGLVRAGLDASEGFVVVTSRCSFEMVEKTARMGCPMIVAVSAPTDLAILKAEEAGVTLIALARPDGHAVFSHPERMIAEAPAHV
ncbi:formate dehydrogenase accessory sulfurtransferase FdhD [Phenylobacterium aquaticum]|uniref:formate dehydrogenase accessory sulfurtransferase FdhD n=1 Tax=Phenylobacterium aquaticum TaxID=1763816 RepID=UPI001F5C0C96|nr:formate dehydrogenase accessory sulfurtransferase FdhD [Phenylobacterium aquaticum]MCI3134994.1 formate dehydrogenase accessory sulfurtransferase FdhD [Phenylobacterium aquaticum]